MKLKKIAALALAGIMAVSMLAGCKGNTTDDNSASSTPVVQDWGAKLNAKLKNDDIVNFKPNSTYDAYLASAIKEADLKVEDLMALNTTSNGKWNQGVVTTYLQRDLSRTLTNYKGTMTAGTDTFTVSFASGLPYAGVYTAVYCYNGDATEEVMLNELAKKLDSVVTSTNMPKVYSNTHTWAYTGSVSVEKVTSGSVSTWIALVTIDGEATKL